MDSEAIWLTVEAEITRVGWSEMAGVMATPDGRDLLVLDYFVCLSIPVAALLCLRIYM
jgi:hypothetical protein